jgi:hypothetical protein
MSKLGYVISLILLLSRFLKSSELPLQAATAVNSQDPGVHSTSLTIPSMDMPIQLNKVNLLTWISNHSFFLPPSLLKGMISTGFGVASLGQTELFERVMVKYQWGIAMASASSVSSAYFAVIFLSLVLYS